MMPATHCYIARFSCIHPATVSPYAPYHKNPPCAIYTHYSVFFLEYTFPLGHKYAIIIRKKFLISIGLLERRMVFISIGGGNGVRCRHILAMIDAASMESSAENQRLLATMRKQGLLAAHSNPPATYLLVEEQGQPRWYTSPYHTDQLLSQLSYPAGL